MKNKIKIIKNFIKENWFRLGFLVIFCFLCFLAFYISIIKKEEDQISREAKLEYCLNKARTGSIKAMNNLVSGVNDLGSKMLFDNIEDLFKKIEAQEKEDRAECVEIYSNY